MEDGGMLVIKPENYDKSLVSKRRNNTAKSGQMKEHRNKKKGPFAFLRTMGQSLVQLSDPCWCRHCLNFYTCVGRS